MTPEKSESEGRSMKKSSPTTENSSRGSIKLSSVSSDSTTTKVPHYLKASTGSCHDLCKHGYRSTPSLDSTKTKATLHFRASTGSFHHSFKRGSNLTGSLRSSSGSCHEFCKDGIRNLSEEGSRKNKRGPKPSPKKTTMAKSYDTKSGGQTCPENQEAIVKREVRPSPLSSSLSSPMLVKPVKVKLSAALKGRKNSDAVYTRKTTSSTISSKCHSVSSPLKTAALKGRNNVNQVETGTSSKMPEKSTNPTAVEINTVQLPHKEICNKKFVCKDRKSQELVSNKIGSGKSAKALPRPQSQPSSLSKNLAHVEMTPSNPTKITMAGRVPPPKDKPIPLLKLKFRQGTVLNPQPSDIPDIPRRLKFRRLPSLTVANETSRTNVTSEELPDTATKLPQNPVKNLRSITNSSSKNAVKNIGDELLTRRSSLKKPGDNRGEMSTRRLPISYKSVSGIKSESLTKRSTTPFKRSGSKDGATSGGEIYSLKIRLKHRSMQKKKATQVLFNNVIEETASKLVKSRKSKVKALVGAFETVIQELRPATKAR